jgi:hypothetical protein
MSNRNCRSVYYDCHPTPYVTAQREPMNVDTKITVKSEPLNACLAARRPIEDIFAAVEDGTQQAKIIVDLAIAVATDLTFIIGMKSPVTQSKFISLMDQDVFNAFIEQNCEKLPIVCVQMLSTEKIAGFIQSVPVSKLVSKIGYYPLIQKAVSQNLIDINVSITEGGSDLLTEIVAYGKSCGSDLNKMDITIYQSTLETVLMHSDGKISADLFKNSNGANAAYIAIKYYENRCRLLEAQIESMQQQ